MDTTLIRPAAPPDGSVLNHLDQAEVYGVPVYVVHIGSTTRGKQDGSEERPPRLRPDLSAICGGLDQVGGVGQLQWAPHASSHRDTARKPVAYLVSRRVWDKLRERHADLVLPRKQWDQSQQTYVDVAFDDEVVGELVQSGSVRRVLTQQILTPAEDPTRWQHTPIGAKQRPYRPDLAWEVMFSPRPWFEEVARRESGRSPAASE